MRSSIALVAMGLLAAPACAPPAARTEPARPSVADTRCDVAAGPDSGVDTPFLALIRDDRAYRALAASVAPGLPALEEGFLPAGVVLAAFLGARPTPGYRVSVARTESGFRLIEEIPPADAILPQVVTTPFAVAAYAAAPEGSVRVDPGTRLGASLQRLEVRAGTLTVSGGIAGSAEALELSGFVLASSLGGLTTLLLDLTASSGERKEAWKDALTFERSAGGAFEATLAAAGEILPPPCRALAVSGSIDPAAGRLSMRFAPGPCSASDAFAAQGELTAAAGSANAPR